MKFHLHFIRLQYNEASRPVINVDILFFSKLLEGDCFPCTDAERCSNMGFYADKSPGRGIMYLATREEEPFCGMISHSSFPCTVLH